MEPHVFIGLGSNQGDRLRWLAKAQVALEQQGLRMQAASPVFETPPWGKTDQPVFYNQVVRVATMLAPQLVLDRLLAVEASLGRVRAEKWGPRTIDLDLLAYGDTQLDTPALKLPHPGVAERAFVLVPWAVIAPGFVVPGLGQTVLALCQRLPQAERAAVQQVA